MACKLPEAITKIEEILSKNGEGIASAILSGIQINMLNEAKNNLKSAIEIRMARMQNTTPGSESIDITKKDFRSEFKNKRPSAAKWVDKEVSKFDVATQAISDGTNNSTAGFVKDFYGDKANTGTYTKDDVIYLSTNGNRTGRIVPVKNGVLQGAYKNIDKAIEAGAKFVADTNKHLASTEKYNVGEIELAEYLQSKGYTREDKDGYGLWSQITSSIQNDNKSSEPSNKSLKSKAAGWKIHLSFKVNDDSVSKLEEILNSFDKDTIPSFKIGRNSGQEGKDATIYVGSADNRNLVVNKIQNEFGKYLTEVGEDAKFDDKIHSKGIAYRFDIGSIDNEFHQYGHNGFPALNEDIKNTFGMNKDERTKVFIESSKKSEKILEKKYGTFFTGTIEDSNAYNPQSEQGGIDSILNSGIDEKVRDIKISDKDLEILKKENEELTKKTGVSIKWIENDANADFNYNPDDNYVTYVEGFNDTITTVLQNHELKHALTFQYLKKNENDNKVKELIKGVNDFKDRLTELRARESKNAKKDDSESYISKTNDLYERVAYMLENSSDSKISNELRQVAEIVAILSAEKDISEQFLNEFKGDKKSKIKILIYWIKSKLNFSEVKTEYYFSPENIVKNVDKIVKQSSKEYNKNNPKIKYETISKDDIEAAKDIMSNNKKECE